MCLKVYRVLFPLLFLFSYPSYGIYHWETKQALNQSKVSSKYWLLLDQNCHFCDAILLELETFCKGRKPSSKTIGFFVIGLNKTSISKKLKSFNKGYEIYLGSPSEFYSAYSAQGSPSLLLKGNKKIIQGKDKIMKKIRKSINFCSL